MTATLLEKRNRPNYYILLRYLDETTKKKRQKWVMTDIPVKENNKRKVEKRKEEVLAELNAQQVDLSKNVLFTDFMKSWLENLKHSIAPTTYDGYDLILKSHILPYFETRSLKVRDLTPAHIQQ